MLTRVHSTLAPDVDDTMTRVIGACIEVHRHLGPGFLEEIYHRAVCVELGNRGIVFNKERRIGITYKGVALAHHELDLVVESRVIVEIKAVAQLEEIHVAQVVSYLKATGMRAGLLVNFNKPVLKDGLRRIVF